MACKRRLFVPMLLLFCLAFPATANLDCGLFEIGLIPLNDLGRQPYKAGHKGGLYPGGKNVRPDDHLLAGLDIAMNEVYPRNDLGERDDQNGLIGMASIGMCNTSQEFDSGAWTFVDRMLASGSLNPRIRFVNGAQGGQPAASWAGNPDNVAPWSVFAARIQAELDPDQVQVVWIKQAESGPANLGTFPAHAETLRDDLKTIMTRLVDMYPNVRLCFLSSRTRAYTDVAASLNPEPFAYESGFSVRWLLEMQIDGDPALAYGLPSPEAPWLSWGPYLWADGEAGRSDGFLWFCEDLVGDFTHPSVSGEEKVSDQLIAFFKTDPAARPWFLKPTSAGLPPSVTLHRSTASGAAPLTVRFVAEATDDGSLAEYAWTFGDGGFAYGASTAIATKTFLVPGDYEVSVTVTDDDGDWTNATTTITVTEPNVTIVTADADAYVRGGNQSDVNFGDAPLLNVRAAGGNQNARAHVRFDLEGLPTDCTGATLNVVLGQIEQGDGVTVVAFAVDESWSESEITWSNQPPPGRRLGSRFVCQQGTPVRFDVTRHVLDRIGKDQQFHPESQAVSFVLAILDADPTLLGFWSRDGLTPPKLELFRDP